MSIINWVRSSKSIKLDWNRLSWGFCMKSGYFDDGVLEHMEVLILPPLKGTCDCFQFSYKFSPLFCEVKEAPTEFCSVWCGSQQNLFMDSLLNLHGSCDVYILDTKQCSSTWCKVNSHYFISLMEWMSSVFAFTDVMEPSYFFVINYFWSTWYVSANLEPQLNDRRIRNNWVLLVIFSTKTDNEKCFKWCIEFYQFGYRANVVPTETSISIFSCCVFLLRWSWVLLSSTHHVKG